MSAPVIGITTRSTTIMGQVLASRAQASPEAYVHAISRAGGHPVLIPSCLGPEEAVAIAKRLDGILLSGGPDVSPLCYGAEPRPGLENVDPPRDRAEIALTLAAAERSLPLFGICRGLQVMNVAFGGTLIQDLPSAGREVLHDVKVWSDGPGHTVTVVPETLLARIVGSARLSVNSSHHQAADRPGTGLVVGGTALDGTIEALEHPDHDFLLGVQWHPERSTGWAADATALFAAFVKACRS
jgi:putative glutamine amidotransferase